jgi:hypothetical protein
MRWRSRSALALLGAAIVLSVLAPSALATTYVRGGETPGSGGGGGALPFTGAELGLYAAAGVALIVAGVVLRRAARRAPDG